MKRAGTSYFVGILMTACGVVGTDYVPQEETFRWKVGTFIVNGATTIEPIYGNVDVDSICGKYEVGGRTLNALMAEIQDRASQSGWRMEHRNREGYEFHRRRSGKVPSYEIVRVAYTDNPVTVYVAWIQIDGATTSTEASASGEGRWAERELWPRFERMVEKKRHR